MSQEQEPYKYPVGYKIIPNANLTKEELYAQELGGTDQVIIISIMGRYGDGKPRSQMMATYDGHNNKDVADEEMFQSWVMMAHYLMDSEQLGPNRKRIRREVFNIVKDAIKQARAAAEKKV